ncbi:hypothetical protein V9K67_04815 [Paraflavisolibacter sp. H34]|uniref:hypothetical protein n=1 Tax=Huijunlia imazamoxiresistens TaxID=3127457 RepID=UPI003015EA68
MKGKIFLSFLFLQFFCACNNEPDRSNTTATSENDVDAARNFIRLALDGRYDKARDLVISDSANTQYINLLERIYRERMDPETKRGYRNASINIFSVNQLNDSISVISYSNSFKKRTDSVKVVRQDGAWKVDLKYSFPAPPAGK